MKNKLKEYSSTDDLKKYINSYWFFRNNTDEDINLVTIALSSGYFDQAHFNREYKKLTGFSPNNETMSILYNT
jgi:AraC-like DNA-binding protein